MSKILILIITFTIIFTSCSKEESIVSADIPAISTEAIAEKEEPFIDKFIFLGESTTYHLKSRGVLSEGTNTKQVWAPKSGTLMLDFSTCYCRIVLPETNQEIELTDALRIKQPEYMMLTFGLNGATMFLSQGKEYFQACYQKLIDTVMSASPNTKIYINSCFPVAKNMDMSNYKIDSKTLNDYIDTINLWARDLALKNGIIYINTASTVKDSYGYLNEKFQAEDGYHLNASAYKAILEYIKNTPQGE